MNVPKSLGQLELSDSGGLRLNRTAGFKYASGLGGFRLG